MVPITDRHALLTIPPFAYDLGKSMFSLTLPILFS